MPGEKRLATERGSGTEGLRPHGTELGFQSKDPQKKIPMTMARRAMTAPMGIAAIICSEGAKEMKTLWKRLGNL